MRMQQLTLTTHHGEIWQYTNFVRIWAFSWQLEGYRAESSISVKCGDRMQPFNILYSLQQCRGTVFDGLTRNLLVYLGVKTNSKPFGLLWTPSQRSASKVIIHMRSSLLMSAWLYSVESALFEFTWSQNPVAIYGIKIWICADSQNAYVSNLQVYTGMRANRKEANQGQRVVMDLVKPYLGSGRGLTTDNFFTSLPLAQSLLKSNITITGTLRTNKADIPSEFLPSQNRQPTSCLFGFTKDETLLSYVPKPNKCVILHSTQHHGADNCFLRKTRNYWALQCYKRWGWHRRCDDSTLFLCSPDQKVADADLHGAFGYRGPKCFHPLESETSHLERFLQISACHFSGRAEHRIRQLSMQCGWWDADLQYDLHYQRDSSNQGGARDAHVPQTGRQKWRVPLVEHQSVRTIAMMKVFQCVWHALVIIKYFELWT